jgi:hypothetical protein
LAELTRLGKRVSRLVSHCVLGLALLPLATQGQTLSNDACAEAGPINGVANAICEVKGGNFAYVSVIVNKAGEERAVPILRDLFASSGDTDVKEFIAAELFKLGQKDAVYWNFMYERATLAAESPSPLGRDEKGNLITGVLAPDFIAWAKSHNISPENAFDLVPGSLLQLAMTRDPRSIPVLREAMSSQNFRVLDISADGLAILQDTDSIPLLIATCAKVPPDTAPAVALALLYFDDPRAQSAAKTYMEPKLYEAYQEEKRLHGKYPSLF